jgi:hypothetical protein
MRLCARDRVKNSEAGSHGIAEYDDQNGLPESESAGEESSTCLITAHVEVDAEPQLDELQPAPSLPLGWHWTDVFVGPSVRLLLLGEGYPPKSSSYQRRRRHLVCAAQNA